MEYYDMIPNPVFDRVAWRDTYKASEEKKEAPPKKPPAQILKEKREAAASSSDLSKASSA